MSDDAEVSDFFRAHCAVPGGVVLAICYDADGEEDIGIFSTLAAAREWTDSFPGARAALFSPYIIDQPDYGNVPPQEMN